MTVHRGARLTPHGRAEIVRRVVGAALFAVCEPPPDCPRHGAMRPSSMQLPLQSRPVRAVLLESTASFFAAILLFGGLVL